jgi:hypothetical protein
MSSKHHQPEQQISASPREIELDVVKRFITLYFKHFEIDVDEALSIWTESSECVETSPLWTHAFSATPSVCASCAKKGNAVAADDTKVDASAVTETRKSTKSKAVCEPPQCSSSSSSVYSKDVLDELKLSDLKDILKSFNLPVSGKKSVLVDRILQNDCSEGKSVRNDKQHSKKPSSKPTSAKTKTSKASKSVAKVISQIDSARKTVDISRNEYGNFVHRDTGLVFDEQTQHAIGYQLEDGQVGDLNEELIDVCKENMFEYCIPAQLEH